MRIVNMSSAPEQVKLVQLSDDPKAKKVYDYINVMPKRHVDIPEGFVIDSNWATTHPLIKQIQTEA